LKSFTSPGQLKTVDAFTKYLQQIDSEFKCVRELAGSDGPMNTPVTLYPGLIAGNRFAVHPMEGWDGTRDGLPSENTLRRWEHFGKSGAKLVWGGEAFAVQEDGRANPNQLFLNRQVDVAGGLGQLRSRILDGHRSQGLDTDDLVIGLQLTHSGRFSRPDGNAAPKSADRNALLDEKYRFDQSLPLLTDGELEGIGERFVESARMADEIGFQFVDVKCCHGYLLHELLGARTRPGKYGGSFANRTLLFRQIISEIQANCPNLQVGVRLSVGDVHPFTQNPETRVGEPITGGKGYTMGFGTMADKTMGMDLTEPFLFLQEMLELGITLVNVTLGSPYYCPHLQRPALYPPSDGYLPPEDPLLSVYRHIQAVRAVKAAYPQLTLVGTGYSYLQEWLPHVAEYEVGAENVDFVGLGRMVLSYPDLPLDVLQDRPLARKKICRTFSDCTTAPRKGLPSGCYPLDPHYKKTDTAALLKRLKKEMTRT
jgi:2,4-dienoyl-CoA reductase-like NADH-dependent reductase (Old Yellow Enzyme family)